jgi:hypothetical protein
MMSDKDIRCSETPEFTTARKVRKEIDKLRDAQKSKTDNLAPTIPRWIKIENEIIPITRETSFISRDGYTEIRNPDMKYIITNDDDIRLRKWIASLVASGTIVEI